MSVEFQEKDLLARLAQNDKEAVETIYKQHYNMVQTLVINNSGSSDDARDVFQEALIVLYEKVKTGTFELNCLLKTYIYSVARRLWLKRLSQLQKFVPEAQNLDEAVQVDDQIEVHEQKNADFQMMERAMQHLGEPCKGLLEAYYLQKKNMVEIADIFGYTNADNAKNQKYKCLLRLKKIFFEQYKNTLE